MAEDCSQLLESAGPHGQLTAWMLAFFQASKSTSSDFPPSKLATMESYATYHNYESIPSNSQAPPTLKGRELYKM